MSGISRIELKGDGSAPSDSLGFCTSHQNDQPSEFLTWNDEIDAELSYDQFQEIQTLFGVDDCPQINFEDFSQQEPADGRVVRDGSLVQWSNHINSSCISLDDSGLNSPFSDTDLTSFLLFNENSSSAYMYDADSLNPGLSEADVVSVCSEEEQEHVLQESKFNFLMETKVELDSSSDGSHPRKKNNTGLYNQKSDNFYCRQKKRPIKKYQSSDEDYEVDDDDDDYEDSSVVKNKKYKSCSKRKRSSKSGSACYDVETTKRNQNRKAAIKYRDKKKQEDEENEALLEKLNARNAELKRQKQEKELELQVLKKLFDRLTK